MITVMPVHFCRYNTFFLRGGGEEEGQKVAVAEQTKQTNVDRASFWHHVLLLLSYLCSFLKVLLVTVVLIMLYN